MTTELALKASDFKSKVLASELPVLVDFWAEWCGPCKVIAPFIEQIAQEFAGQATVYQVNVDDEGEIAEQFGIMSIPTLILFKRGRPVMQLVGQNDARNVETLLGKLEPHL